MNSKVTGEGAAAANDDDDDVKKMSECQTKAGNQECLENLAKLTPSISHLLTLDMLTTFVCPMRLSFSAFVVLMSTTNAMVKRTAF